MLTPLDIHNKVFGRAFRGYRMEEVDAFLDEIIRDHEAFYRENAELKATVARMTEEAAKSREIGATLEKTMVLAQRVYEEEAGRAKKEADIILWEADKKAEGIIEEAQNEVLEARQQIERLRMFEKQLYLKHKGFLDFQMELLDGYREREATLTESDMEKLISGARERDLYATDDGQAGADSLDAGGIPDVLSMDDEAESSADDDTDAADVSEVTDEQSPQAIGMIGDEDDDSVYVVYTQTDDEDSEEIPPEYRVTLSPPQAAEIIGEGSEYRLRSLEVDEDDTAVDYAFEARVGGEDDEAGIASEDNEAKDSDSPFIVKDEVSSMEQVVLLAQKMEEALQALDTMYADEDEDV